MGPVFCRQNVLFWLVLGARQAGGRQCSFDLVVRAVTARPRTRRYRDPGITWQMTSPAARVIAAEAKLLWAGLKLQAVGFGNADSCFPHRLDENY